MSVANRKYEFAANAAREVSRVSAAQPGNLEAAVTHVLHSELRQITDYEGYPELQSETAVDIATRLFGAQDFDAALMEYEQSDQGGTITPIEPETIVHAALQAERRRQKLKNPEKKVFLAASIITHTETDTSQIVVTARKRSLVSA